MQELHVKVRANIEMKNEQYARQTNKGRGKVVFELEDWVWVGVFNGRVRVAHGYAYTSTHLT